MFRIRKNKVERAAKLLTKSSIPTTIITLCQVAGVNSEHAKVRRLLEKALFKKFKERLVLRNNTFYLQQTSRKIKHMHQGVKGELTIFRVEQNDY